MPHTPLQNQSQKNNGQKNASGRPESAVMAPAGTWAMEPPRQMPCHAREDIGLSSATELWGAEPLTQAIQPAGEQPEAAERTQEASGVGEWLKGLARLGHHVG